MVPDFVMITQPLSKARMQDKWNQNQFRFQVKFYYSKKLRGILIWACPSVRPSVTLGYGQEPVEVGLDLEIVYIEQA